MRTCYVNGSFVAEDQAKVSIFDRGFLFADSIYEVTAVLGGKLVDFEGHMLRLQKSLSKMQMTATVDQPELLKIHRKIVELNKLDEGIIYLQITRGVADRDFLFPPDGTPTSLVMFTQEKSLRDNPAADDGIKVITIPDQRWGRCDIKTPQLVFASLSKMQAQSMHKDDVWLERNGYITEGSSNNTHIISKAGNIITHPVTNDILSGITRASMIKLAEMLQIKIEERPFTAQEAKEAKEAFITSATTFVMPVVEIDGQQIGDGKPGAISKKLRELYLTESLKHAD